MLPLAFALLAAGFVMTIAAVKNESINEVITGKGHGSAAAGSAEGEPTGELGGYTKIQLEKLWKGAGGSEAEAKTAAAIALAESKGHANAINYNSNGTVDRGLWQINSSHGSLSTFNPTANAESAVRIHNETGGFGAWTTYGSGAYREFLE